MIKVCSVNTAKSACSKPINMYHYVSLSNMIKTTFYYFNHLEDFMKKLLVLSFFLCIIYSVSFAESKYETTAMAIPDRVYLSSQFGS